MMDCAPCEMGFQVQVAVRVPALTFRAAQPLMTLPLARNATVPVDEVTALSVKVPPLRGVPGTVSVMEEVPVAMVIEMDCVEVAPASSVAVMVNEVALLLAAVEDTETTPVTALIEIPVADGESEKVLFPVPPVAVSEEEDAATP